MTTASLHSRPMSKRQARPKTGRTQVGTVDVIAASAMVFRPVVVSVAIVVAAITWSMPAHADPGNGGLAPPIASFLAGQAIQAECPAFITAIANGTMPFPLTGASTSPTPFALPGGSPAPFPLQLPGMNAPTPSPLQLPGL